MNVSPMPAWYDRALCSQVDAEAWFPSNDGEHMGWNNAAAAVKICGRCPVSSKCLAQALENNEEHGIWGGLLPAERRRLTRKPRRVA